MPLPFTGTVVTHMQTYIHTYVLLRTHVHLHTGIVID